MGQRTRYVVVGIVLLAVLVGVSLGHLFEYAWAAFGWDEMSMLSGQLTFPSMLGYALALGGAVFVLKHKPTYQLANEVVDELSKVTWPSREETGNATVVVIVTVLLASAYLGIFDAVWLSLTNWILGVNAS